MKKICAQLCINNLSRNVALVALFLLSIAANQAKAGVLLPSGIQQNVSVNTITNNWGWSVLYQGDYGLSLPLNSVFGGAQQYVMIGAIQRSNPGVVTVMAGALTSDVLQLTATDTTHLANGVNWYFNGLSMGFTPITTISQNSADTSDAPGFGGNLALGAQKLSWHMGGVTQLNGGWRAGNTTFLNSPGSGWDRIVFTGNASSTVPEPTSIAVLGGIAVATVLFRRRKVA